MICKLFDYGPLVCSRRKSIAFILFFDKKENCSSKNPCKGAETDYRAKFIKEIIAGYVRGQMGPIL